MALFGYLFDSNFKDMRDRDKVRGESAEEVSSDPFEDARTVRRLRADMARGMILNRALIRLLIQNDVITLEDLTELSKQIHTEDDPNNAAEMEVCKNCNRHSFRARANCVYCGSLQV